MYVCNVFIVYLFVFLFVFYLLYVTISRRLLGCVSSSGNSVMSNVMSASGWPSFSLLKNSLTFILIFFFLLKMSIVCLLNVYLWQLLAYLHGYSCIWSHSSLYAPPLVTKHVFEKRSLLVGVVRLMTWCAWVQDSASRGFVSLKILCLSFSVLP